MDHEIRTVDLANRLLAYREFGDPDGAPILYFHATPSTGAEAALIDAPARERGLRIIAPDRPGMGGSSMSPNQRIVDWPRDITFLLGRLGIERAGIISLGAGAPYAFACGERISKQVATIAVVSPRVPAHSHLLATASATWAFVRLAAFEKSMNNPERAERVWASFFEGKGEKEQQAARSATFRRLFLDSIRQAFTNGYGGPQKDYAIASGANWGFAMGNVQVDKCFAWLGEADERVPVAEAKRVLERLPHCDIRIMPGEGHFSTWINHHCEVLDTVAESVK